MLNPYNIQSLLTENTDLHASHFTFMTVRGNLLGHEAGANVKSTRRFAAYAATTWLKHDIALKETGQVFPSDDIPWGRTLRITVADKGEGEGMGLHGLVVEVDGMVGAVAYVTEKLLVAAQMEQERFGTEDELIAMVEGSDVAEGNPGDGDGSAEMAEGGEHPGDMDESRGDESVSDSADGASNPEADVKFSKLRILEVRAEGMADYMREELKDFKMPSSYCF